MNLQFFPIAHLFSTFASQNAATAVSGQLNHSITIDSRSGSLKAMYGK